MPYINVPKSTDDGRDYLTFSAPAVAGNVVTTNTGSLYVSPEFIVTKATPEQEKRESKLNADQAFQRIAAAAQVYLNEIKSQHWPS